MPTPREVSEFGLGLCQDDWFGVFVPWGLHSLTGANGWEMFRERCLVDEHKGLATRFKSAGRGEDLVSTVRREPS